MAQMTKVSYDIHSMTGQVGQGNIEVDLSFAPKDRGELSEKITDHLQRTSEIMLDHWVTVRSVG